MGDEFGVVSISRSICDGQRGYTTTYPNGCKIFRFKLSEALSEVVAALGHKSDREILVIGTSDEGNEW